MLGLIAIGEAGDLSGVLEGKRAAAPHQPKSPDKSSLHFKSGDNFSDNTRSDVVMQDVTEYEDHEKSVENENGKMVTPSQRKSEFETPTTDEPEDNDSDSGQVNESNARNSWKKLPNVSKTLRFSDEKKPKQSPEIDSFFAPKSSKKTPPGKTKIVKLSPKEPPKQIRGRRTGVTATNQTADDIEETSSKNSEEVLHNDRTSRSKKKENVLPSDIDSDEEEDWDDAKQEEEEDDYFNVLKKHIRRFRALQRLLEEEVSSKKKHLMRATMRRRMMNQKMIH